MELRELDDRATKAVYTVRWLLYPLNVALSIALAIYVATFLFDAVHMVEQALHDRLTVESSMVILLGMVDAMMVANLVVMIIQGSHQIFIHKLPIKHDDERPQWLDHIDSGILKVKVALSIAGITLVQVLRDFADLARLDWTLVVHRVELHLVALASALVTAVIWRVTHPQRGSHA